MYIKFMFCYGGLMKLGKLWKRIIMEKSFKTFFTAIVVLPFVINILHNYI